MCWNCLGSGFDYVGAGLSSGTGLTIFAPKGDLREAVSDRFICISPVVLITGGMATGDLLSEIYDPFTETSCSLPPNLPDERFSHTQDGLLLCGGTSISKSGDQSQTCLTWNQGSWDVSHHLSSKRSAHISWTPATGNNTYLMGGYYLNNEKTTDIVGPDGAQERGFDLENDAV